MNKLLFITNGHGEDLVAAEIIKRLPATIHVGIFPLVGEGSAFENLHRVEILGGRKSLPGGGFSLRNLWYLIKDLSAGLIFNVINNMSDLKKLRGMIDLTVAVGDVVPVIGALTVKAPFIFVGVNKSDYYKWFGFRYTPWEKWLLKRYAKKIYVRDQITMENLNKGGIPADYVGNPLMDCIGVASRPLPTVSQEASRTITIGFLPGTREDAKLNVDDFEKVVEELTTLKDPDTNFNFLIATVLRDIPEYFERKVFADVLKESDLIIGLSGTGNEQAAGSGKPVVSFYGRGSQYNKKFAEAQKQLLGNSLALVRKADPLYVAVEAWCLLHNPQVLKQMGETGKQRMGSGGAADRITAFILHQAL